MTLAAAGVPDVPLAVHDLGGSGEAALLVHAAGFHGRVWAPVAARLGNRVHSWGLDLRGHGDSGPCATPDDWIPFGDDVLAAVGGLGVPALGIGHSLGAGALLLAEAAAPGTFRELVLYEPAVSDPDQDLGGRQAVYAGAARRRRAEFAGFAEAYENFAAKPPTDVFAAEVLRAYTTYGFRREEQGGVRIKCDPATEAAIYEADGRRQIWSRIESISCPVTLVRGSESDIWERPTAEAVAARIGATLEVLPGAGHFGPLQAPEAFAELVGSVLVSSAGRFSPPFVDDDGR